MNAQLRKIDERGEILIKKFERGEITFEVFAAANRKLVDRAETLLARAAGK